MPDRSTQRKKIKDLLWDNFGKEVALPEILPFAAQYSARIYELRRELRPRGYDIFNRTETQADGTKHSWFRLDYRDAIDVTPVKPQASRHETASRFEQSFSVKRISTATATSSDMPLFAGVRS